MIIKYKRYIKYSITIIKIEFIYIKEYIYIYKTIKY